MKKRYFIMVLGICCVFISIAMFGYGGGGSVFDPGVTGGQTSNISVKMNMLNYSDGSSYVSIPSGISGRVNISVKSIKANKEVANKTVDFNAGFLTFDNEIPVHDTYSVSVRANLHYKANDTYEVVWAGVSPEIYVYSNEETAQRSIANEAQVGLKFLTIEFVKLYPAKLVFEPELPLAELVKGTVIPPFKVKVIEQFGNVLPTAAGDVTVGLHSGAFKSGIFTKSLSAGVASFDEMGVAELIADSQGFVKLEASYSGVTGYSQPMKAIGAIIPNASVAGYLNDTTTATASAAAANSGSAINKASTAKAPIAGKQVFLIADNVEYQAVTDLNGFYKFDIRLSGDLAPVKLTFQGTSGPIVSSFGAAKGKTQIVIVKVDPSGAVRIQKAFLEGNYTEAQDLGVIEKLVSDEIARIRSSATGVTGLSGRVILAGDSGLSGVSVTIKESGDSAVSGAGGVFSIQPPSGLKAGNYNIGAEMPGFIGSSIPVNVTEDDYGFSYDGSIISISEKPNSPPAITGLSISGVTGEINLTYSISDPDSDLCGVEVYYSLDGGLSYFNKASVSGDVSGVSSGSGKNIIWHSTADFLSNQTSVRLKLIPADPKVQGAAVESSVFQVNNLSLTENKIPAISGVMATVDSGEVSLAFSLADGDNDSCSIEFYYSVDGGTSLVRSINFTNNARFFPGQNSIVWNSLKDVKTNQKNVKVRLVPNDSKTSGSWGESQTFALNNLINTPPAASNLMVSGLKGNILLAYDIIDLDQNLCTAEVYFSINGGASFKKALGITGDTKEITGGTGKKIVWNSKLDIADNAEGVIIKIVPSDEFGYGSEAISSPVPVYNSGFRPQISNLSTAGSSEKIIISYDILDKDSGLCTVEVSFSKDDGTTFTKTANISGDTSVVMIAGTAATAKKIIWNSFADFKTNESKVKVKLTSYDETGAGTEAVSLVFAVNNIGFRPVVSNFTTIGASGEITLKYDLADADSSPCFISVQYSINNSAYIKTLNLTGETSEISAGTGKSLIWNSKADISGLANNVTLKLIAADMAGTGTETVSLPFTVNNNSTPIASNLKTAGNTGNITVSYDLADPNSDTCSVELYYSIDGGTNYKKSTSVSGAVANVAPGAGNKLIWNSTGDIGQQNVSNIKVKILPYDAFEAGMPAESTAFSINNYVQITPTLQSAEFVYFSGGPGYALKMTFNTSVAGSSPDLNKIFINNTSLFSYQGGAPSLAPSRNSVMRIIQSDVSGNIVTVRLNILDKFQQCFGINGDFIVNSDLTPNGLIFQAGNGIKSGTGNEVAANIQPYKVHPLLEAAMLTYNNNTGNLDIKSGVSMPSGISSGYVEVFISSIIPADTTSPTFTTIDSSLAWSASEMVTGAPHPAGSRVYYRFNSTSAVKKSEWVDYGPIPNSPALFGSGNIAWSNVNSQVYIKNTKIGSKNSRIKVYENLYNAP
ncbi:MAG TPA: carboxypeptidase-like regulatory domain-containing protein, partial [Candidatus Wallbacteria bacterium]|nr:carboxypeptidase-like regulatory domain-containing protein [Candidatus Wallbacteria bacterium]